MGTQSHGRCRSSGQPRQTLSELVRETADAVGRGREGSAGEGAAAMGHGTPVPSKAPAEPARTLLSNAIKGPCVVSLELL